MSVQTTGILEHLDPTALDVATNVRAEAHDTLTKDFLESIRQHGVITPIIATRDENGVHVRAGQRRTLAAQAVALTSVPVYVVDVDTTDDAQRIIDQLIENEHRQSLTDTDRVAAWRALELDGLSITQIAKRTGTKRDQIKTGLTIAGSETGTALVAQTGLTLDQAATLLEFEDAPEMIDMLTAVGQSNPNAFNVEVQKARDERRRDTERAAAAQIETEKGHTVLDSRPAWDSTTKHLSDLKDANGVVPTAETIQGTPGIAVYLSHNWEGELEATYYIENPQKNGYTNRYNTSASQRGPMSYEEKAERKTLIANNKEWDAAETVRREWLTTFFARKTLPKDAPQVIARGLTAHRFRVEQGMSKGNTIAADLLTQAASTEHHAYTDRFSDYLTAHPAKAAHITLAVVLGGIEFTTGRDSWRNPSRDIAEYLTTLAAWGYALSPVEKIAAMTTDEEQAE